MDALKYCIARTFLSMKFFDLDYFVIIYSACIFSKNSI